ncbi:hypothetical protein [Bacillus sp. V2I10]|uniref:hypothetical protein n=1 Tax=Bacillus sp. V2I10 TaxID=3042276 RepID=UPI002786430D|nr:hypothetical protein [Bacillus sp. V2I10]MDQ0861088.1 hypothetical protein [Bacillus sp. V2I10]
MTKNNLEDRLNKLKKSYVEVPVKTDIHKVVKNIRNVECRTKLEIMKRKYLMSFLSITTIFLFTVLIYQSYISNNKQPPEDTSPLRVGLEDSESSTSDESPSTFNISFDTNDYQIVEDKGKHIILPKDPLPRQYPKVLMEIEQIDDTSIVNEADKLHKSLSNDYKKVEPPKNISSPFKGVSLFAIGGSGGTDWNDPVIRIYITSNQLDGVYIIKQHYFIEASEGHGARFDEMLNDFHIIKSLNK